MLKVIRPKSEPVSLIDLAPPLSMSGFLTSVYLHICVCLNLAWGNNTESERGRCGQEWRGGDCSEEEDSSLQHLHCTGLTLSQSGVLEELHRPVITE